MVAFLVLANSSPARAQSGSAQITGGAAIVTGLGGHDFAWERSAGGERHYGSYGIGGGAGVVFFTEVHKTFDSPGGQGSSISPAFVVPALSVHESYYPSRKRGGHRLQPF